MKKYFILFLLLIIFSNYSLSTAPSFQGTGTENDPYLIWNKNHITELSDSTRFIFPFIDWTTGHFRLMENIDTIEQGIGSFTGYFHGNGKKITVYLLCEIYPGNQSPALFISVEGGGSIDSLIVDGYVNNFCGRAGITDYVATRYNSPVSGIYNCISNVRIISRTDAGGITYLNNWGEVSRCINNGSVTGVERIGGVAATNLGTLENCINTGKITATASGDGYRVGGIAGWSGSAISNCINLGEVHGQRAVSGIAAFSYSPASVFHCINYGYIKSEKEVGGVAGFTDGTAITNCVNVGAVEGDEDVGSIVGKE